MRCTQCDPKKKCYVKTIHFGCCNYNYAIRVKLSFALVNLESIISICENIEMKNIALWWCKISMKANKNVCMKGKPCGRCVKNILHTYKTCARKVRTMDEETDNTKACKKARKEIN